MQTQTDSTKQAEFSDMTHQEMRDWANGQLRSGEISLDDSRPESLL